jgi:processive 1,2-diacylglycerol beta-glucosyltransferase
VADALRKALVEIRPEAVVEVVDALAHCARWFRLYYNSYEIPLRYWPALWGWIENIQHKGSSTGPGWLYRRGARPLFRFIEASHPDVVVATETGLCEMAALLKRDTRARFYLVGVDGIDVDRAWAQPDVDLYPIMPGDVAEQLQAAGVPPEKILPCGMPIDPAFSSLPDRLTARKRLEIEPEVPLLLVLFGGTGFGKPGRILAEIEKVRKPLQAVFITGKHRRLEEEVRGLCRDRPHFRVLGWVNNMHEWMAAADLVVNKPSGVALLEAMSSGLPFLAVDPLPGNELRHCNLIERWSVGHWVRRHADLAPTIERLLAKPGEIERLRRNALALARPRAAYEAAEAVFKLLQLQP